MALQRPKLVTVIPFSAQEEMTLKIAFAGLLFAGVAIPAFAEDLQPPPDFDEAAWQAEFDAGDTDGDGRLSREEVAAVNPRALEIFDQTDLDGDGYISPEEDKTALFRWYRDREVASAED